MAKKSRTFNQIPLLRTILAKKRSGSIRYCFSSDSSPLEKINITSKQFSGEDITQQMKELLSRPTYTCEWNSQVQLMPNTSIDAIVPCLCSAVERVVWKPKHALALKQAFLNMPAIHIEAPDPAVTYSDMSAYIALYRFTEKNSKSSPKLFFATASKKGDQMRYLKVLVLVYCLGFMSIKKAKKIKKDSIATRVLKRMRKI